MCDGARYSGRKQIGRAYELMLTVPPGVSAGAANGRGAQLQLQQGAELQRVACFIFCLYVMRLLLLARNCTLERASVLGCACFAVSEICCPCHRL